VWDKLQPLIIDKCSLDIKPRTRMPATWVKQKLVCEIKFQEWTQGHIMRQAIFMGLRTDKKPTEVKKETAMATNRVKKSKVGIRESVIGNPPALKLQRTSGQSAKKTIAKTSTSSDKIARKNSKSGEWLS